MRTRLVAPRRRAGARAATTAQVQIVTLARIFGLATLLCAVACNRGPRLSQRDANAVVRQYSAALVEAFRAGDVRIVLPLSGPELQKRHAGLIGSRLDMGLSLDAKLLELQLLSVNSGAGTATVETDERWTYRDRRIGTDEQVGEESTDHYRMRYRLRHHGDGWIVDAVEFAAPPEVGRKQVPQSGSVEMLHGVTH